MEDTIILKFKVAVASSDYAYKKWTPENRNVYAVPTALAEDFIQRGFAYRADEVPAKPKTGCKKCGRK